MGGQVGAVVADEGRLERRLRTADRGVPTGRWRRWRWPRPSAGRSRSGRCPCAFAESLFQRLAQGDGAVLDGVVRVGVQVAFALQAQRKAAVGRDLLQHMVEEADAGLDLHRAGRIQIDGADDAGLLGVAHGLTHARCRRRLAGVRPKAASSRSLTSGLIEIGQAQTVARQIGLDAVGFQARQGGGGVFGPRHDDGADAGFDRHQAAQFAGDPLALAPHRGDPFGGLDHPRRVQRLHAPAAPAARAGRRVRGRRTGGPASGAWRDRGADPRAGQTIGQGQAAQDDQVRLVG